MSIIGVPLLTSDPDGALSDHFGKAKWLGVFPDDGPPLVIRNHGLNGRAVTEVLAGAGCSDVIVRGIGGGALGHLDAAGIRAWRAPDEVQVPEVLAMFAAEGLSRVEGPDHGGHQHGHGGCGCG